jgi:hypothetical protein
MRSWRTFSVPLLAYVVAFIGFFSGDVAAGDAEFSALAVQIMPDKKETVAKLYVGDGLLRTEMGQGERQRITIVNTQRNTAWMVNPSRQEYVELKRSARANVPSRPPLPGEAESACGKERGLTCTKVGAEKINGRNTEKWEIVMSQGDRKLRSVVWVDRSLGMPVREKLPGGYVRELRDIQEARQDPSLFQIPAGYKRIELPKQPPQGARPADRPSAHSNQR